jgi:hypothetical protein
MQQQVQLGGASMLAVGLRCWLLWQRKDWLEFRYSRWIRKAASSDDKESLVAEAMSVRDEYRDRILHLQSRMIQDEAEKLGVPAPRYDSTSDQWEAGINPNTVRLTVQAQAELRTAIRAEKRDRWSVLIMIVKEIALPVIALIGGVTGLIATLHSHSK